MNCDIIRGLDEAGIGKASGQFEIVGVPAIEVRMGGKSAVVPEREHHSQH